MSRYIETKVIYSTENADKHVIRDVNRDITLSRFAVQVHNCTLERTIVQEAGIVANAM